MWKVCRNGFENSDMQLPDVATLNLKPFIGLLNISYFSQQSGNIPPGSSMTFALYDTMNASCLDCFTAPVDPSKLCQMIVETW